MCYQCQVDADDAAERAAAAAEEAWAERETDGLRTRLRSLLGSES